MFIIYIFNVILKVGVPKAVQQMVSKLVECGFLSNKVRKYVDSHSSESAAGLVGQVTVVYFILLLKLNYCC